MVYLYYILTLLSIKDINPFFDKKKEPHLFMILTQYWVNKNKEVLKSLNSSMKLKLPFLFIP